MTLHATVSTAAPEEIKRTQPDFTVHDPTGGQPRAWDDPDFLWLNEHLLVVPTWESDGSTLLATWTSARLDPSTRQRVAVSRSEDGGQSWSPARYLDGSGVDGAPEEHVAAWQMPIVAPSGRIYLFYTCGRPGWHASGFRWRFSDDDGRTWSDPVDRDVPRNDIDGDDGPVWIACSKGLLDRQGRPLIAFSHWASTEAVPAGKEPPRELFCQIEMMRLDNLAENPAPEDIQITWLCRGEAGAPAGPIRVPHAKVQGASFSQEPYLVRLPDDRLFMVIRTNRGELWWSVSGDDGVTWEEPKVLRTRDGGEVLQHPCSPAPVYDLSDGRYLLMWHDNDGWVNGAVHVWDVHNRRPSWAAIGTFGPEAEQPLTWGEPWLFIDNDNIGHGPPGMERYESAAYGSLTTATGEAICWYPDRKCFLLGKRVPESRK